MTQKQNRFVRIMMGVLLVVGMLILAKLAAMMTDSRKAASVTEKEIFDEAEENMGMGSGGQTGPGNGGRERMPGQECIIIDAGHGGIDPGKVGVNGVYEKDINLQMAFLLKERLEADGYYVLLTRTTDEGLYEEYGSNMKLQDLQNRIKMIAEEDPLLVISIHQNSYTQESVCGAQVFYYETSDEGSRLAESIQRQLILSVADGNHRQAKGNTSYFLLKKTPVPTVIVECGFLSNWREAELLLQEDYQRKMVNAIADGIRDYVENKEESSVSGNAEL